jgi:hypothetical protein
MGDDLLYEVIPLPYGTSRFFSPCHLDEERILLVSFYDPHSIQASSGDADAFSDGMFRKISL